MVLASMSDAQSDSARVTRALGWLSEHYQEQPSLDAVAAVAGSSVSHFQRLFTQRVGEHHHAFA